jgi:hypothetical protein
MFYGATGPERRAGKGDNVPVSMLDAARFPLTVEYLRGLSHGLDSFPRCRVRVLVFESMAKEFPILGRSAPPGPLAALLRGELQSSAWIPEVVGQVANLMLRDACLRSDSEYMQWAFRTNTKTFEKPLLRGLMRLISPSLIVIGASRRWNTVHEGSELSVTPPRTVGTRVETVGQLRYPRGLFSRLFLEGLVPAFSVALELARGRDVRVTLNHAQPDVAEYAVSWAS